MQTDYSKPDWDRIAHLFKLGIIASLLALMMFSAVAFIQDKKFFSSALAAWICTL